MQPYSGERYSVQFDLRPVPHSQPLTSIREAQPWAVEITRIARKLVGFSAVRH